MLAEHEARHGEPRLGLLAQRALRAGRATRARRVGRSPRRRRTSSRRASSNTRPSCGRLEHHVHHADLHRASASTARRATTSREPSSAERHAASVIASDSRLWRAELNGSRSSAIARASSASVPANPSGYQAPSSVERATYAVAVELDEVRAEQHAAANRALGAVDPERHAGRAVRASPTMRISTFAPSS